MFRLRAVFAALFLTVSPAYAQDFAPLIEPDAELSPDVLIIDIRSKRDFAAGHIPGAVNAPYGAWRGPNDNPGRVPSVADLQTLLRGLGAMMDRGILVVHEGRNATDFGAAARVYWTLKSAGFDKLAILNGGYRGWVAAGQTTATQARAVEPSDVEIVFSANWMMDADGVRDVVAGATPGVLLDARPLEFFKGEKKHGAARQAGTLAGALNIVHSTWFNGESPRMDASPEMIARLQTVAAENTGQPLVSFCNTGHWAATNWFVASEIAGIEDVRLYPESMVGWTLLGNPVSVRAE